MTEHYPESAIGEHWFEAVADHLGSAYLRYSFTKGTRQEADFLVEELGLQPGDRVLDVGCGPGRHSYALAERGMIVHGVDISQRFVDIATEHAPAGATFERGDARAMTFSGEFDAVVCLCQGGFGLQTAVGHDELVLEGIARAAKAGGRIALSAFSSYFVLKHWEGAVFDADRGMNAQDTEVKSEAGVDAQIEMWTGCYTPRELRLLARAHNIEVDVVYSVEPGKYGRDAPTADTPEFLLIGTGGDVENLPAN